MIQITEVREEEVFILVGERNREKNKVSDTIRNWIEKDTENLCCLP